MWVASKYSKFEMFLKDFGFKEVLNELKLVSDKFAIESLSILMNELLKAFRLMSIIGLFDKSAVIKWFNP